MNEIAVLIPCLNEEPTIRKVINNFKRTLPGVAVYVYDNGSTDFTATEAKKAGAIVRTVPLKGKGNVVRVMFKDVRAKYYVLCDGDDTYGVNSVPEMVDLVKTKKYDLVIGKRTTASHNFTHKAGNRFINMLIRQRCGGNITDALSGLRVCSEYFVDHFPAKYNGFETEAEMAVFAITSGLNIAEVPVGYKKREGTQSKLKAVSDGRKIIRAIVRLSATRI